jgi:hypothetical protein
MQHQKLASPTSIFCVAAPSDAALLAQWETHLLPLEQAGILSVWSERHLLLDGLDEMEEHARPACITAINAYHRDDIAALVVCSRTTEYQTAAEHYRLALQDAVVRRLTTLSVCLLGA